MSEMAGNDDFVDVIVPLTPRYASTLRTLTASFGVDTGFSIDEIDDFKLALTEAFSMLVTRHAGKRARTSFAVTPFANGKEILIGLPCRRSSVGRKGVFTLYSGIPV